MGAAQFTAWAEREAGYASRFNVGETSKMIEGQDRYTPEQWARRTAQRAEQAAVDNAPAERKSFWDRYARVPYLTAEQKDELAESGFVFRVTAVQLRQNTKYGAQWDVRIEFPAKYLFADGTFRTEAQISFGSGQWRDEFHENLRLALLDGENIQGYLYTFETESGAGYGIGNPLERDDDGDGDKEVPF